MKHLFRPDKTEAETLGALPSRSVEASEALLGGNHVVSLPMLLGQQERHHSVADG